MLAVQDRLCDFVLQRIDYPQHSSQLGQELLEVCFAILELVLGSKERIIFGSKLVDLLNDPVSPFLVVFDLIDMPMGVFPKAALAEIAVLFAFDFRAVVSGLLLMEEALLFDPSTDVLELIDSGEFFALHTLNAF